jgi:hypothetical protein
MGAPTPGGPPMPSPMAPPPGAPGIANPANKGPEKKKRPSITFLILDFLVFGGAVAAIILLFISN